MKATLLFSPFLALGRQLCELPDAEAIRRLMGKNLRTDALDEITRRRWFLEVASRTPITARPPIRGESIEAICRVAQE